MTPSKKKILGGAVLLSVLFGCFSVYLLVRSASFRKWVETRLREKTGYEVRIGDLRLKAPLEISASAVTVSKSGRLFFQGKRVILGFTPLDFFYGRIHRLAMEEPVFRLRLGDLLKPPERPPMRLALGTLTVENGELLLATEGGKEMAIRAIHLNAGNINLAGEGGLSVRVSLPWLDGDADLSIRGGPDRREGSFRIRQREQRGLPLPTGKPAGGGLESRFTIEAGTDESYHVDLAGSFRDLRAGPRKITGQFRSRLDLAARLESAALLLELTMPELPLGPDLAKTDLPRGPNALTVKGSYSASGQALKLEAIKLESPLGIAEGSGMLTLAERRLQVDATLRLREIFVNKAKTLLPDPWKGLHYAGKTTADLHIYGPWNGLRAKGQAQGRGGSLRGENLLLSRLSFTVPFEIASSSVRVAGAEIRAKGLAWSRKGRFRVQAAEISIGADQAKKEHGAIEASGGFRIAQARFSTPDESKIGEKLTLKGRWGVAQAAEEEPPLFRSTVEIQSLELLWDRFFGDFREQRPVIELEGQYLRESDEVSLRRMSVALRSAGALEVRGRIRQILGAPSFDIDLRSEDLRPGEIYDFFIRETFKRGYPTLGRVRIAGKSILAARVKGSRQGFSAEGGLRWDRGEISERSGKWQMGPIELDLPFRFRYPRAGKEAPGAAAPKAGLSIQQATLGATTIPAVRASFIFWDNSLRLLQPIPISLYGGSIVIDDLVWKDIVGEPEDLSFSLQLNQLHLLPLTEAMGWYRFGGTLSGSIPQIRSVKNSLRSAGELRLEVFGGRVTIGRLEVQEPFSPLRSVKMDLRLEEIDLEQATESFAFGRIAGILEGTVQNLVVTQGQAAEFRADLHTVERSGVGQWISVEALNRITVLSSGEGSVSLYGGLGRFFDYFRYSKLGFKARLRNDRLFLEGIESREGKEYLVLGSFLPPTVDVISHTREIGFGELMRRLERIRGAQKTGKKP